jgi:hypothetical protein
MSVSPAPVRRDLSFGAEWRAEVARWVGRGEADGPGPAGWILGLLPEFVDPGLRFDRPALQVYQRVAWRTGLPPTASVSIETAWCSPARGRSEIAVATRASTPAGLASEGLLVVRLDGEGEAYGERAMPPRPQLPDDEGARTLSVVLGIDQVRTFARLARTRNAVHDDPVVARRMGYPDVLVQGAVLLLTVMHYDAPTEPGSAEMWFRAPVPVGSLLRLTERPAARERLWTLRLANGEVAAIARITDDWGVGAPTGDGSGERDRRPDTDTDTEVARTPVGEVPCV